MKKLYFIRHGESKANLANVSGGRTNSPLTEKGIKQAEAAGKSINGSSVQFDLIVSSPMIRAYDTAKAISKHTKYDIKKN